MDLTLTKTSLFKLLLSTNKFKLLILIFFLPSFSFGPTIISFLSELIFRTYRGSASETLIPFLWPIVKLIIPSWTPITFSSRFFIFPFLKESGLNFLITEA